MGEPRKVPSCKVGVQHRSGGEPWGMAEERKQGWPLGTISSTALHRGSCLNIFICMVFVFHPIPDSYSVPTPVSMPKTTVSNPPTKE